MKTFRRGDTLDEVDLFRSTRHEADSVADPTGPPAAASVRRGAGLAGIVAALLIAPSAGAIEFRVESQTLGDAYQLVTSGNEVLNRNRLHQLLGLSLYDLEGSGENLWSFTSLFRFGVDFGLTEQELDEVVGLERTKLSIQYAMLQGQGLLGGLVDIKLGRQLMMDGLDYLMMDGGVVTLNTPFYLAVELHAGLEVRNDAWDLNDSQLETDGTRFIEQREETTDAASVVFGAALMTRNLDYARYRVGYRRFFSSGAVDAEKVGGSFHQRVVEGVDLSGIISWDLFNGRFDRIQAGGRVRIADHTELDLEYVRTNPTFDGDSIFNIFSVYPMNDLNARWRFYAGKDDRFHLGGKVRLAGNEAYDDPLTTLYGDVDTMVSAWGAMAGWHHSFGPRGVDGRLLVDFTWEGGFGGDRIFADVGGVWAVVPREWEVEGRLTVVDFADELQENLHAFSFGYQLGGRYLVDKKAAFAVVAEHNMNRLQTHQFRVFALIDLDIWL